MRRQNGFTLLEVMVALLGTAVALAALVQTVGRAAVDTGYLRDRTQAAWVAQNVMTDLRLATEWPALGTRRGQTTLLGRTWYWQARVVAAADPGLRKAEVTVASDQALQQGLGLWAIYLGEP